MENMIEKQGITPYLCGGTFLTLAIRACRKTVLSRDFLDGEKAEFHEEDVTFAFSCIANPHIYRYQGGNTAKTKASNYKNCHKYTPTEFQFADQALSDDFKQRLSEDYDKTLYSMCRVVNAYIDTNTKKGLYLAKQLIDVIKNDSDISADHSFTVAINGATKPKSELENLREIHLPAFLLSVWAFVVTVRNKDNSKGKATLNYWRDNDFRGLGRSIENLVAINCDSPELPNDENETEHLGEDALCKDEVSVESAVNGENEADTETKTVEDNTDETNQQTNQFLSQNGVFFQQFGANSKQFFGNIKNLTIN